MGQSPTTAFLLPYSKQMRPDEAPGRLPEIGKGLGGGWYGLSSSGWGRGTSSSCGLWPVSLRSLLPAAYRRSQGLEGTWTYWGRQTAADPSSLGFPASLGETDLDPRWSWTLRLKVTAGHFAAASQPRRPQSQAGLSPCPASRPPFLNPRPAGGRMDPVPGPQSLSSMGVPAQGWPLGPEGGQALVACGSHRGAVGQLCPLPTSHPPPSLRFRVAMCQPQGTTMGSHEFYPLIPAVLCHPDVGKVLGGAAGAVGGWARLRS